MIVGPAQAAVVDNEFYGASGSGAATVPFYAYASVNVAACVASGTTTTAASTTSTVAPSTTVPVLALVASGDAVCDVDSGRTTVTWTVRNEASLPMTIADLNGLLGASGRTVQPGASSSVDQVIDGPTAARCLQRVLRLHREHHRHRVVLRLA